MTMGILQRIGSAVSSVTGLASKVLNLIRAPLDAITRPLASVVNKVLDKVPFGLGKLVKPFVNTFLNQAVAWLAGGPLGGFLSMMGKIAPTVDKLATVVNVADAALKGGLKSLPQAALSNAQNAFAYTQAQSLLD
jgi:uncharacterized protein YlaN (UPF0358 family)